MWQKDAQFTHCSNEAGRFTVPSLDYRTKKINKVLRNIDCSLSTCSVLQKKMFFEIVITVKQKEVRAEQVK